MQPGYGEARLIYIVHLCIACHRFTDASDEENLFHHIDLVI